MSECQTCGKTISIWKINLAGDPICKECKALAEAEELTDSFPCLIPDRPLTQFERAAVGMTTMGAGRSPWREARMILRDGYLHLEAIDEYKNKVELGEVALTAGESITLEPISTGDQIKVVIGRAIILGLGVGSVIAIGMVVMIRELKVLPYALGAGAVGGLVVGIISCLAVLFKVKSGLMTASLETEDGYLHFLLKPDQIAEARRVLGSAKITLGDPDYAGQGGERPVATPMRPQLRKGKTETEAVPTQNTKLNTKAAEPEPAAFRIECPNCQRSLKARPALIGKTAKCPACKTPIFIRPPKG